MEARCSSVSAILKFFSQLNKHLKENDTLENKLLLPNTTDRYAQEALSVSLSKARWF